MYSVTIIKIESNKKVVIFKQMFIQKNGQVRVTRKILKKELY